jgi:flagellar hook-basal body complex protein FliE
MKNLPIVNARDAASLKSAAATSAKTAASASGAKSVSSASPPIEFQALIERLRDQARTLEQSAEKPLSAKELPSAVQAAQASLHDALSIADGLVEAYRSSLIQIKGTQRGDGK